MQISSYGCRRGPTDGEQSALRPWAMGCLIRIGKKKDFETMELILQLMLLQLMWRKTFTILFPQNFLEFSSVTVLTFLLTGQGFKAALVWEWTVHIGDNSHIVTFREPYGVGNQKPAFDLASPLCLSLICYTLPSACQLVL